MHSWLNGMGLQGMMGQMGQMQYTGRLRAYSAPFYENADVDKIRDINYGGKILLPSSVLDQLVRLNIQYPMLFKLANPDPSVQRATHCGVLEFSAEEGRCYLPAWLMGQLCLAEGGMVCIDSATLPKASYAKLKPQSVDFLNIFNPKAVLEVELRKFACLTKNDRISVLYADRVMEFLVQEVKPSNSVCIIECDLNLDFDAPEGYVEEPRKTYNEKGNQGISLQPAAPAVSAVAPAPVSSSGGFAAFVGSGARLDGKRPGSRSKLSSASVSADVTQAPDTLAPVVCNEQYKPGHLNFVRYDYKARIVVENEIREKEKLGEQKLETAFKGSGATIRKKAY